MSASSTRWLSESIQCASSTISINGRTSLSRRSSRWIASFVRRLRSAGASSFQSGSLTGRSSSEASAGCAKGRPAPIASSFCCTSTAAARTSERSAIWK